MNKRDELIKKAKEFWAEQANRPAGRSSTRAEAMADFALSLEAKDEWPQKGDKYWHLTSDDYLWDTWDADECDENRAMRGIYRTKAKADLADRQRIARTAIHRWIAEQAEKVDWEDVLLIKHHPKWDWLSQAWDRGSGVFHRIPGWFYVYEKDYDRMMADNAQHFDVLKEGE